MRDEGKAKPQQEQKEQKEEAARTEHKVIFDVLIVASIALIVRAFTVGYTILWSRLISSYKFSNDLLCDEEKGILWSYLKCFSSWDGEYFLRLSLNEAEYLYEQNHAFFPALPLVVGYLKRLLEGVFPNVGACSMHVLICIVANNFLFVLSVIGLYLFAFTSLRGRASRIGLKKGDNYLDKVKSVEDCRRLSFMAALLFTFNMGSIHMSSFYSESFFSCLSIWGFNFLQWSLNFGKGRFPFELLAVLSFSVASLFRSNGILFLIPLFVHTVRTCAFCVHCAGVISLPWERRKTDGEQILNHFLNKRMLLQFVLHWGKALLEAALVVLPFVTFQAYAYHLYCVQGYDKLWKEEHKKFLNFSISLWANPIQYASRWRYTRGADQLIRRPWCDKTIPFVYNYIQHKYWDVQFLKLLRSPSGSILYALPVYLTSFHAVYDFFRNWTFPRGQTSFLFTPFLGEVLHLGVLCFYLLIFAHGEIILRLIASSPLFYIHYAYQLKYSDKWNFVLLINLLYFFIGPPLFGTYIAWT
ncbi:Uncharacterized protein PCOAH_00051980 [Plasmodium coatneyi]|uniref:GPI mannosyltransferase 2 n=1 Tax=Plasmodium coatneyi TaxID=208452 RepID=A0A1B1E7L8_9APIC|nr:Uncharacterized protein PCOAH_00051980 [Plasmodium coatneyi]ANQ11034.1 Uncharacterized protein PCOAH_00051980 [Plasmodium coatneyi]